MPITLTVNGQSRTIDIDPDTPLLWAIRETLGLTGTKFGCGIAQCGACTVHVNGKAERSCTMPVSSVDGATITTIEGLANGGFALAGPAGLARHAGAAMRLLPVGNDHGGVGAPRREAARHRR